MADFLKEGPVFILLPINERQQNVLQAGAHCGGQGIGHCGGGSGAGGGGRGGTGAGAGQTVGYDVDGIMAHVAIPQGEVQGYMALLQAGG